LIDLSLIHICDLPAAIHLDSLQPAGNTRWLSVGNEMHIRRDNSQCIARDFGSQHIPSGYARSEIDVHPALDSQPAERLGALTHNHLVLGSSVEDVVVDHRDVGNVLRLADDGDVLSRRENHPGEAG